MPEPKNLLISVLSVAVLVFLGYMLVQMIHPDPYAGVIVSHVKKDNDMAASQILATIKGKPKCGASDLSHDDLLKYYKSQECFMLKTEMRTHHGPTEAQLSGHGNAFIAALSPKLKMCMSPDQQRGLMGRMESGKNLKFFLHEIDQSKNEAGKLERIGHMLKCGS
jgi:hypothetical protein